MREGGGGREGEGTRVKPGNQLVYNIAQGSRLTGARESMAPRF